MKKTSRTETIVTVAYAALVAAAAVVLLAVPIRAFAADVGMPVPVAVIYPGQSVLDKGVAQKRFRIPGERLAAYALEDLMLEGKVAKRTLLPGKPILLADLKTPDIVKAGVATTLVFRDGGLMITSLGTPLRSAAEGEAVQVRNADSGVLVTGVVASDGTVEVR